MAFDCSPDGGECNIHVDIDGPNKGAYTNGKDIFVFTIEEEQYGGLEPWGVKYNGINPNSNFSPAHHSQATTEWVINYGNMDYLKANSDGKCPNNIQLNWTAQTSCK